MTASVKGLGDLNTFLASLPANLEAKVLRGALKAGAEVIAEGAKENLGGRRADTGNGSTVLIADSVVVTSKVEPGVVTARIQTKGGGAYVTPWLEFGTDPHFISVDAEASGGRTVRRINRLDKNAAKEGRSGPGASLVIGGAFVGKTVHHPGAQAHPFMRPAVDMQEQAAVAAIGGHIAAKLTRAGIETPQAEDPAE